MIKRLAEDGGFSLELLTSLEKKTFITTDSFSICYIETSTNTIKRF